jgi:hypothetical protein
MKRPGFSISTLLLVGILIGAVAFVGSMVNPIKRPAEQAAEHSEDDGHGHGAETKPEVAAAKTPPEIGKENMAKAGSQEREQFNRNEAEMRRTMMKKIAQTAKVQAGGKADPKTPLTDPTAIDPTPTHFFQSDMGDAGMKKQEAVISEKKKAFDAAMAKQRANPLGKTVPIEPGQEKSGDPGHGEPGHVH